MRVGGGAQELAVERRAFKGWRRVMEGAARGRETSARLRVGIQCAVMYEFGHSDIYTRRSNASNTQFPEFISMGGLDLP